MAIGLAFGLSQKPPSSAPDPHFHSQIPRQALITDRQNRLNLEWMPFLDRPLEAKTPVLLSFWATWCYPCLAELPEINALARDFQDLGLRVILVNIDPSEDLEPARKTAASSTPDIPFLWDKDFRFSQELQVGQLPYHILMTGDGRAYARWFGGVNWQAPAMRNSIKSFLEKPEALAASLQ